MTQKARSSQRHFHDVVIVSYARTPITSFMGAAASMSGPDLAAVAIQGALSRAAGLDISDIQEAFFGNVVSAGIGQAPTRQAVLAAGCHESVPCTTINKVCASGMKAIALAAQQIMLGHQDIMLTGGFESMSNIPYYLPKARGGNRLGHGQMLDGVIHDGLWDPYNNQHMGVCGEVCATRYGISKAMQDDYAIESYRRAATAASDGRLAEEIVPLTITSKSRKKSPVVITADEEISKMSPSSDAIASARAAFQKNGTISAANASSLNDGAAALVLMSSTRAKTMGLTPLARIRGFGDAAAAPVEFTTAPALAIPRALTQAQLSLDDIELHEINEAFAVVPLINATLLQLDLSHVNVNGGAVSMGHPIGMSGARIVGALYHALKQQDKTLGVASICNGGGGASALVLERLS